MSIRIVLYAEGTRETGLETGPAPGVELDPTFDGPGHVLVRRCLNESAELPEAAIRFLQPLRTGTGRKAHGSDFLDRTRLRKLLAWGPGIARPHLAVILVDADGEPSRRRQLQEWTHDLVLPRVVAMAIQEFEAWLIADPVAVRDALETDFSTPPAPESLPPRQAKYLLAEAIGSSGRDPFDARMTIARTLRLDALARSCPAFAVLRDDLLAVIKPR